MNASLIQVFFLISLSSFINSQIITSLDADPIVVYNNVQSNPVIRFNITNIPASFNDNLGCRFIDGTQPDYSSASFDSVQVTSSSIVQIPILRPFTRGRTNAFVCNFQSNPLVNIRKYLSVRPLSALVCNPVVVTGTGISVPILFTAPLLSDVTISCTFGSITFSGTARAGLTFVTIPGPAPSVSGTCTAPSIGSFNVPIIIANVNTLSPSTIVTNSPIIKMTLTMASVSSQPITVNCSLSSNINTNPTCPFVTTTALNWTVTPASFQLQQSVVVLTVNRTGPMPNGPERFLVVCCTGTNPSDVIVSNVTITNQAKEYAVTASGAETVYNDVQYNQLSSCPCDLTVGICDANCCCDRFCNCTGNVIPIPGPYGGYFNDPLARSCKYRDGLTQSTYQMFMCVEYDSSNILGDYFPMQSTISDANALANKITSAVTNNGFQMRLSDPSATQLAGPSAFIPITSNLLSVPYLYLPKQVANSPVCDPQAPIAMMQGYDATCSYTVTPDCSNPSFNARYYLMSSTATATNCANNGYISSVVGNIAVFTFYTCEQNVNCSANNGFDLPPTPLNSNNQCQNAVRSVLYQIYYNQSGVVFISANVTMGSPNFNTVINQIFKVQFISTTLSREAANAQSFPSLISNITQTVTNISGLYGYDDGKPIITVNDTSNPLFRPMRNLPISSTGNCNNALGSNVLFRQNSLAQCSFNMIGLSSCNDKRNAIKTYLDSLFNNSFIAIYGNPSGPSDYVAVNVLSPSLTNNPNVTLLPLQANAQIPLESMAGYCSNVPTALITTIYYARQGRAQNQYINNIVGAAKRYLISNLTSFSPFGSGSNASSNIVTLTSYVEFVLLPASGLSGNQSTSGQPQSVCNYDVCINELFYPWMFDYEGKQGFYEQSFGLFLLGLALFLLVTTYPWW